MPRYVVDLVYLLAASLFIMGLKGLGHPRTAVRGNLLGSAGMLLAVVVTLLDRRIVSFEVVAAGMAVGAAAGTFLALKIRMTAMPQLVGVFNGFGGAASLLVAGAVLLEHLALARAPSARLSVSAAASGLIGAVTFWGSMVAFGKLQGLVTEKPVRYPGSQLVKGVLFAGAVFFGVLAARSPGQAGYYWYLVACASVLGVLLTVSIGGADMPVVIALLNAYSGLAAAATGFVLSNSVLIISGSLVGASGIILTRLMCRAMNRSLANVLFGGVGGGADLALRDTDEVYAGKVKATTPEEVGMVLKAARRVVFVPGYGMAVARAQHVVRVLYQMLEQDGVE
ncbi:MAG: NAD(P)(+) transhydrogenase (Re/Si-specific) subunit beta, partial [Spirochaetota bacterium]